jgi:uncharacterized membrane protein
MTPEGADSGGSRFTFRGTLGLIAAVTIVAVLLVWLPAYRLFFGISLLIGIGVAGGLYLWHRYKPIKAEDVQHPKRPLGLD